MYFLDKLERAGGRFAVPGLLRYIVVLNALVYLLLLTNPGYQELLVMDRSAVARGEIWRLVTWIFIPNTTSPLWILFYLMFTWWVGDSLEAVWGTFRLNLYYFLGVAASSLAAFAFGVSGGNYLLVLSLLLALATVAPNEQVLLLVFPVKLKWVALISLAYPWGLFLLIGPPGIKAVIVLCLANYLLFFGPGFVRGLRRKGEVAERRKKFEAAPMETLHRCQACGITEASHPDADFRVADDGHEYCTKHLPW